MSIPAKTTSSQKLSPRKEVEALPDLSEKLKERGLHEEYLKFREGYMRWRKGEAAGAKGELDHVVKRSENFMHWYSTVGAWNFRRTISFWSGALTTEGCLLFLWVSFFSEYGRTYVDLMYYLTKLPNLCGGTAFLFGIYMNYFELINMDSDLDTTKRNYLWCDWRALLKMDIELSSIIGAIVYLVGALMYSTAQISDCYDLDEGLKAYLVEWNFILGGFLFVVAGVCEMVINRVLTTLPDTFVWWVSVLDFLGGLSFWLSACPSVCPGGSADLVAGMGSLCYLAAGLLVLLMWRGEQYGNALIPVLNHVSRQDCTDIAVRKDEKTGICHIVATRSAENGGDGFSKLDDVLSPRLSRKGLLFLTIYVLVGVIQIVTSCGYLAQSSFLWKGGPKSREVLSHFVSDVCNIIMVHMVLILNTACIRMPKPSEQPYRALYIMVRGLSLILVANSVLALEVIFELDVDPLDAA